MGFTAQDVKTLRETTGVGMMDCKNALVESDGDMEKAILYLRERGLAAAQKKAGRITAEGIAYANVVDNIGVVCEVNTETDFVAKNEKFTDFVEKLTEIIAKNSPADIDALMKLNYSGSDKTVADELQEMILVIGENISVRRFERYDKGFSVPYVHAGGKIGVIVNLTVSGIADNDAVTTLGKDIAMQIAAMRPTYLDVSSITPAELEQEKEIQLKKAIEEGMEKNDKLPDEKKQPEDKIRMIAEKIAKGRVDKFYAEVCLLNQPYVKDDKLTVEQHIARTAKQLGGSIVINAFTRFEKGEGIEKKQDDFAAEVASMV